MVAARWVSLRPPRLAQGLGVLALTGHLMLWGTAAPLGRLPALGAGLALAGMAWMLWAAWCFRQAQTTIFPTGMPTMLVDEGPFRFGRNPMYLGLTVAIAGLAVALGSPLLVLAALLFFSIVAWVHVPFEEQRLRQVFGGWYSDYAASVRRWL
ncbi:methyltransferase family protein [Aquabacterium sp.]|uniref:methyltransferase family protein n=1 Tax=Aquabacterium sp. TaxID=1872578 RepID=UPI002BDF1D87|nr:methyltransferase [Aquabacterium sp.]HSW08256.1 methyltransferase [Aquabacterium sp.]